MAERQESDHEESKQQDLSLTRNNPRLDTVQILKQQGPEFEPPKENITEKPKHAYQPTGQSTTSSLADPASPVSNQDDAQKKDAELARQIEKLEQEDEILRNQKLPELREQIQEIQQSNTQQSVGTNLEADQDEEIYQGYGQ